MALSRTQNNRLCVILSVMANESVPEDFLQPVMRDGFVATKNGSLKLTKKGLDEKNRLCALAGLNIKYASERKQ